MWIDSDDVNIKENWLRLWLLYVLAYDEKQINFLI